MKILWLSHLVPYPPKAGVLQRANHLVHETACRHELDLLAFHQPNLMRPLVDSLEQGLADAKTCLQEFCGDVRIVDIDSESRAWGRHRLALKSLFTDPYNINWLKSARYAAELEDMLQRNAYDLVHFDTVMLLPYFDQIGDIPATLDHHNIESHMLLRRAENESNPLKRWYFHQEGARLQKFEQDYCPRFSANITCSTMDSERLLQIVPGINTVAIPNAVDTSYFVPTDVEQQPRLIFIGTLDWYPNIEAVRFIAHEIWPQLKQEFAGLEVDIVGASPPEDLVALSNQDERFHVHGFVDDILPLFDRAAVYVCPITDGGGTKLKILDALSMKKAIVAHRIACEGIDVTEGDNVMFAETAAEYIDSIRKLLGDEPLRRSMGESARRLIIGHYTKHSIGEHLDAVFASCVGDGSSRNRAA